MGIAREAIQWFTLANPTCELNIMGSWYDGPYCCPHGGDLSWNSLNQRKFLRVRRGCQASQRKGLTSGEVRELPGKFGELPGKSGKLPGNLWIAVEFHSERTSGEVAEKTSGEVRGTSGEVRGRPRSSGELDSLPATRQICLQLKCSLAVPDLIATPVLWSA